MIGARLAAPERFASHPTLVVAAPDALGRRTLGELYSWLDWLGRFDVRGYVGEFGVPGIGTTTARWSDVLELYYRALDDSSVWATQWAAGRGWGAAYPLGTYVNGVANGDIDRAQASAAVIERHPESAGRGRRGVALAGWEFSVSGSGGRGARTGFQFVPSAADFGYLASRGVGTVRLGMAWERLQPALSGALDSGQRGTLDLILARARAAGISVILDLHNFARYTRADGGVMVLGLTGSLTAAHLANFWVRISSWLRADPVRNSTVVAFGLMNEPHDMPAAAGKTPAQTWEAVGQAVLTAIRNAGDRRTLLVAGYDYAQVHVWVQTHPRAWIVDPIGNFRYEAHHYWDTTSSAGSRTGSYIGTGGGPLSYSTELAAAQAAGF